MYGRVSFRLTDGSQPFVLVPTFVNHRGPFDFILDTGASTSIVSPEVARNLHIEPTETKEAMGAGGIFSIGMSQVRSLSVGQAVVSNLTVGITHEIDAIRRCCGARVDGILGHNFFRDFRLTLDYRNQVLTLHLGQVYPEVDDQEVSPIRFRLAHPSRPLAVLPVTVNGKGPHDFVLDTGATTSVLSPRLADELEIPYSEAPHTSGGGITAAASFSVLESLKVGSFELEKIEVLVSDFVENLSRLIGMDIHGIVGYNYLKSFRVTIDYPRARLGLSPG